MSAYAKKRKDGETWAVDTPSRGVTLIEGLTDYQATCTVQAINRAFANGQREIQEGIKSWLGIEDHP